MKTKFKKGDKIFFMSDNKPTSFKVEGVTLRTGKVQSSTYMEVETKDGEFDITYHNSYRSVNEKDSFPSIDELKDSIFQ